MDHNISRQPVPERVGIYGTDDNRLRALGEVLITDVSRTILKLLFENTFTANDIAIKTGYSLQLVRYHLKKMQDVDLVEISKIGKNTKSHDMKYYTATKFAIVIVPSGFSDKAKSSKSLLRSIKSLYRLGATGIAAIGAWFTTLALQGTAKISNTPVGTPDVPSGSGYTSYNPFYNAVGGPYSGDGGIGSGATLEEMLKLARAKVAAVTQTPHAGSGTSFIGGPIPSDIFWPIVIAVTIIAFGVSIELVLRTLKTRYKIEQVQQ
ncbi:MAG TPA: winged helix-turn-helix domain-containing protein [Candidatus Nitrosotalea sp.]|nr:winged helix-turn-helix domain-containing protein [Candidatus Nitrosotalea sp.]